MSDSNNVPIPTPAGLDRRKFIGASALAMAGLALSRARGQDMEKVTQAQHGKSMTDPGAGE